MNYEVYGITASTAALAFSAIGSALGTGYAGMAAIGAWKKCLALNKPLPFIIVAFVGAPLTQTIYGFILMNNIFESIRSMPEGTGTIGEYLFFAAAGILGGISIGLCAVIQGKAGAAASDAMGETGKGFGNYIMVLGIIETVALFTMVFFMIPIGIIVN